MSLRKCRPELERILKEHNEENGALLPCLHTAQEKCGCLTEEILSFLAEKLNLPKVEVYSVATFYSMFTFERQAKYIIRSCVSLPCYLKGSEKILHTIEDELNIKAGEISPDKKFTIEPVSCLGLCDKAPAVMINEKIFENLTPKKAKEIIRQYKQEGMKGTTENIEKRKKRDKKQKQTTEHTEKKETERR